MSAADRKSNCIAFGKHISLSPDLKMASPSKSTDGMVELATLFISDVVKTLIKPDTVIILFLALACVLFAIGKTDLGKWLLFGTTVAVVVVGIFPFGEVMLRPLERTYLVNPPLSKVEGIIVLGGSEQEQESAIWQQPLTNDAGDRYINAILLANRYPEAKVLFAGGNSWPVSSTTTEADIAEQIFLGAGISRERLLLESQSRNTFENARNALITADGTGEGTWVLVTSAGHMPRALASFCQAGWHNIVPWPTDFQTGNLVDHIGWNLAGNLSLLGYAIKEQVGLFGYRLLGRTSSTIPPGCLA
jgi:uncharacterized SAM-binding protein YcdF (DUF218 family)